MDISIIVPVYNVEPYIKECLHSILDQRDIENLKIECLIVDDRGNDNSMKIVEHELQSYSGPISFRIIKRNMNGGLSAARNSGIKEANGKYLFFLDSDDTISPLCIHQLSSLIGQWSNPDIIYGAFQWLKDNNVIEPGIDLSDWRKKNLITKYDAVKKNFFKLPIAAWNKLINRDWLIRNDLWYRENILYEDVEWYLRAYFAVESIAIVTEGQATYNYRQRPNSIMSRHDELTKATYITSLLIETWQTAPEWDGPYTRYILEHIFNLQQKTIKSKKLKKVYLKELETTTNSEQAGFVHRLLFRYIRLGRPFYRIIISNAICSLLGIHKTRM